MFTPLAPGLPVGVALQEAILGELQSACDALSDRPPAAGVHEARKAGKRVRAALAILAHGTHRGATRGVARQVRDAARAIGPHRDADVLVQRATTLDPASAAHLRALAERIRPADPAAARARALAGFRAAHTTLAAEAHPVLAADRLGGALAQAYAQARRGARAARRHPGDAEAMHAWRKDTKRWTYQLSLFTAAWPPVVGALLDELDTLQDHLGLHHDLAVLQDHLGEDLPPALAARIPLELAHHAGEATRRGRVVFAGRPRHVAGWLIACWQVAAASS